MEITTAPAATRYYVSTGGPGGAGAIVLDRVENEIVKSFSVGYEHEAVALAARLNG